MPYVMENLTQYDLSRAEAEKLAQMGLLVKCEVNPDEWDTTALIWDDLELDADQTFMLFDSILNRK